METLQLMREMKTEIMALRTEVANLTTKLNQAITMGAVRKQVVAEENRCLARTFYEYRDGECFHMNRDGTAIKMRDDPANLYGDRCVRKVIEGKEFCHHHLSPKHGIWGKQYSGPLLKSIERLTGDTSDSTVAKERNMCYARVFNPKLHLDAEKRPIVMEDRDPKNLYGDRCNRKSCADSKYCSAHKKRIIHGVWNGDYEGPLRTAIRKARLAAVKDLKSMNDEIDKELCHIEESESEEEVVEDIDEDGNINVYPTAIDGTTYYMPKRGIDVYNAEGEHIGQYDREARDWIEKFSLQNDDDDE